jgi:hypothetical protein
MANIFRWISLKVYRTVYTAKYPVVPLSLGLLDRCVGRNLADFGFQDVFRAIFQQPGNIVAEPVKPP